MGQFRSKQVVIEAVQFEGSEQSRARLFDWSGGALDVSTNNSNQMTIQTLEGAMLANPGDWIIRGLRGEFYPCKPDVFAAKYEAIDDTGTMCLSTSEINDLHSDLMGASPKIRGQLEAILGTTVEASIQTRGFAETLQLIRGGTDGTVTSLSALIPNIRALQAAVKLTS